MWKVWTIFKDFYFFRSSFNLKSTKNKNVIKKSDQIKWKAAEQEEFLEYLTLYISRKSSNESKQKIKTTENAQNNRVFKDVEDHCFYFERQKNGRKAKYLKKYKLPEYQKLSCFCCFFRQLFFYPIFRFFVLFRLFLFISSFYAPFSFIFILSAGQTELTLKV